jgi:hypothetical protein
VHYTAAKVGRGELFEAIDCLAFLRKQVLGPLVLSQRGALPAGLRCIEILAPDYTQALRGTLAHHDAGSCGQALHAAAALYQRLRDRLAPPGFVFRTRAELAALEYLAEIRTYTSTNASSCGATSRPKR